MKLNVVEKGILSKVRDGLVSIGYDKSLIREDYSFADPLFGLYTTREINLAAFAQEPFSYRNSCIGVILCKDGKIRTPKFIDKYKALGAPQIFALYPRSNKAQRWKIRSDAPSELVETIESEEIRANILAHKDEWSPDCILRAKSIDLTELEVQYDFFDAGLVPQIEEVIQRKLHDLLNKVIATCKERYSDKYSETPDYKALFRLIFRLIVAKLLADRHNADRNWESPNVKDVLHEVESFYFQTGFSEKIILQEQEIQQTAWDIIRTSFHLQNVSLETLAYIYETTFVAPETRKQLDIHATPKELAEYVVKKLPIDKLHRDERSIFEPFAGHAPFLTAALGYLRTLLPLNMSPSQQHKYFAKMLYGMELDPFAAEVAKYSLMLADYPNPNGWHIENADAFTSEKFNVYLKNANIVLCNPPFGDFEASKRVNKEQAVNKAVEALRLVLECPPKMLGFVLPRRFVDGRAFRDLRQKISTLYHSIEVVGLPESTFKYSGFETVLLIAHNQPKVKPFTIQTRLVEHKDYRHFLQTGQPTWSVTIPPYYVSPKTQYLFWYSPQHHILEELKHLPRLGEFVDIHRGIEYNISVKANADKLFSDSPRSKFVPGLRNSSQGFEPYTISSFQYINTEPKLMRGNAYLRPWDKPKVLVNYGRLNRKAWVMAAAVDKESLTCYHTFCGMWPITEELPLEVIAAIINNPVANLSMNSLRNLNISDMERIPVPIFSATQIQRIVELVDNYKTYRLQWLKNNQNGNHDLYLSLCYNTISRIDAEVLSAYDLPPRMEKKLLDFFANCGRPGPVPFFEYYPQGFQPSIPWKSYISQEFAASAVQKTLERLPHINDPAITDAIREVIA